jgi:hypothetical protein
MTVGPQAAWRRIASICSVMICWIVLADVAAQARSDFDLERVYRVIASKKMVDLTHAFGPETPVWAGFGQAKFSPAADPKTHEPYTIPKDGFRATYYEMVGNTAPMSIRRRILPRMASRWTRFRSSR